MRDYLGPALQHAGLSYVHLMIWDHNRGLIYQRANTILSDPEAARYVWGTAFHWYVGDEFENVERVHEAFPDKKLLFSEGCQGPFNAKLIDDWSMGEGYGRSMINDFNHWTCGWTDWNVLLDQNGGPNHVGNYCFAPIIANTRTGKLHFMSSYWYIGQFSRYVRPKARRIACTSSTDDILATAFQNADGRIATIVMNPTGKKHVVDIWVDGMQAPTTMPPHSIETVLW